MKKYYEYTLNGEYGATPLLDPKFMPENAVLIRINESFEELKNSPEYQAHIAEQAAEELEITKDQLWQAATDYREKRISVEGIIELKPYENTHNKAGEIRAWISGIWQDPQIGYYARKAKLEQGESVSLDFSNHGEMPHSFLEAMAEIEGN